MKAAAEREAVATVEAAQEVVMVADSAEADSAEVVETPEAAAADWRAEDSAVEG